MENETLTGTEQQTENQSTTEQTATSPVQQDQNAVSMDDIKKLIQSEVDKVRTKYSNEKSILQKELENLKREKLTAEERRQLELEDKERAIAERERSLLEKENRLYTIKAIKAAGLDDGSDKALELVDFIISDSQEEIDERVKVFSEILNKFVSAKVDSTFKANGRVPNGTNGHSSNNQDESENKIAVHLGKIRAEKESKSQKIINHYIGGR